MLDDWAEYSKGFAPNTYTANHAVCHGMHWCAVLAGDIHTLVLARSPHFALNPKRGCNLATVDRVHFLASLAGFLSVIS
jgi:hypothetical protein